MKKIIYSLVMLIAAGSLLTSCIQPVETDGVLAMRLAKAKYIEALAGLQTANEAVVKAEAKYIEAQTSYLAQQEALLKAQTENQNLLNALQEILNAKEAALAELAKQDLANEIAFKKAMGELELQIKGAELQKFLDDAAAEKLFNEETLRALKAANDIELAFLADSLQLVLRAGELEIALTQEALNALIAANENTAAENAYAEALRALNLSIEEAKAKAQIDSINAAAAVAAVKAEQNLAEAQAELAETLLAIQSAITVNALSLTDEEAALIRKATTDYRNALDQYQTAVAMYQAAYEDYLDACQMQVEALYDNSDAIHGFGEQYQKDYDNAVANLEKWEAMLAEFTDAEGDAAYWEAEMNKYNELAAALKHENHLIDEEYTKAEVEYRASYQALLAALVVAMNDEKFVAPEDPMDTAYLTFGMDEDGFFLEDEKIATNYYVANFFYNAAYAWISANYLNVSYDKTPEQAEYLYLGIYNLPLEYVEELLNSNFESRGEELTEWLSGLKEIIETLKREKVIVNNAKREAYEKAIKDFAEAAETAYADHKAALEAGREADAGVIAARAAFAAWKTDTTAKGAAYRQAVKDSVAAEAAAKIARDAAKAQNLATFKADSAAAVAQAKADSTAIMKAAKDSAKVLTDAVGDGTSVGFVHDINYFYTQISTPDKDTAALRKAVTEFAAVISKYGAPKTQTEITLYNGKDADNKVLVKKVKIADLTKAYFTTNGDICTKALRHGQDPTVETSFGGISDAFRYVIQVLIQNTGWDGTTNLKVADILIGSKTTAQIASDIVGAAQILADKETGDKLAAKIAALLVIKEKADLAADKAYNDVLTAEHTKVKNAYTAYQTALAKEASVKNAIKNAINKYYEIYDAFWGYATGTHAVAVDQDSPFTSASDSLHIVWGEETFSMPHEIIIGEVELTDDFSAINGMDVYNWNEPLNTVIVAMDYVNNFSPDIIQTSFDPESSFIIAGPDDYTELTKMHLLNYEKLFLENYTENLVALDNLEEWVNKLEAAYENAVAELEAELAIYADEYATWAANMIAFTGEEELADAVTMFNAVYAFLPTGVIDLTSPYAPYSLENFIINFGSADGVGYVFAEEGELGQMVYEYMTIDGIEYTAFVLLANAQKSFNNYWAEQYELVADMLNQIYTTCLAHENPDAGIDPMFDTFEAAYEKVMNYLSVNIEMAQNEVEATKKVLALYEAGYDSHDLAVEKALLALEVAEVNLTLAEEKLAIAETNLEAKKAAYEAVVEVYLTDSEL